MKNKKNGLIESSTNLPPAQATPIPAQPARPQIVLCETCVYQVEKTCRLFPPTIQGGWAVYPNVAAKNHGCFQGEQK